MSRDLKDGPGRTERKQRVKIIEQSQRLPVQECDTLRRRLRWFLPAEAERGKSGSVGPCRREAAPRPKPWVLGGEAASLAALATCNLNVRIVIGLSFVPSSLLCTLFIPTYLT
jgi:hypothetical protein